jgi:hypothetical protein
MLLLNGLLPSDNIYINLINSKCKLIRSLIRKLLNRLNVMKTAQSIMFQLQDVRLKRRNAYFALGLCGNSGNLNDCSNLYGLK